MTTRILIGASSSLAVIGAELVLKRRADTLITAAENGNHLLTLARNTRPALVLLGDRFDPLIDTLSLVEQLLALDAPARILVMGALSEGLLIRDLLAMGVSGYLMEADDLPGCLLTAVETVLRQRPYLSPTANAEYLIAMQGSQSAWKLDPEARSVLRLLAGGFTVREIAAQLHLTRRRVYWVCEKMRNRFGASTNEHLISRAAAEGFAGFPD
jgi:DNA-binding NarL/FixJ family response regulator